MQINIFVLCDQDLHETEAGGSRTVIMVNNFLAAQDGITVYSSYKHLSPVDHRIIEIPITSNFTKEAINGIINKYKIDILLIPEGGKYAHLGRMAVNGTNCKLITEFHTKPGYEVHCLWYDAFHYLFRKDINLKKRVYSAVKFVSFPIYVVYVKLKNLKRLQQAYYDADRLIVLCTLYINEYKNKYFIKKSQKIAAIENALSFGREINSDEFIKKNNTILIVSRLEERSKRLSIVFKLWSKICNKYPNWNMEIVGSGIDEQFYRKMVLKLKLKNIEFCGRMDPENYYTKASIFLMTSAYEGWPMTLTEAMQKGCVPVCMDSFGAVHEIINDKIDGFIVPDKNIKDLTEKTEYLIKNAEIRKSMAFSGIGNSRRFSMDDIGPKWIALFQQVLS